MKNLIFENFYNGKTILITGHTGFKGSWLSNILINLGANVVGYSLPPTQEINLFKLSKIEKKMKSTIGDIRDFNNLQKLMNLYKPEVIFHLAAQPLVKESYDNPKDTYETNVIGTLNILEVVRKSSYVKSFVNITTDKVYLNREWIWPYRENEELNGFDPYSNSKSCSELITSSYIKSFLGPRGISISTARSGNVIGGGDFSSNRVIPDCVRALKENTKVILRNPNSTRPYLHVLDTLFAYLLIAKEQYFDFNKADSYNIGPNNSSVISTKGLVDLFCREFNNLNWEISTDSVSFHEANLLSLDTSKIFKQIGWFPKLSINEAIKYTADWVKSFLETPTNIPEVMKSQIDKFFEFYNVE